MSNIEIATLLVDSPKSPDPNTVVPDGGHVIVRLNYTPTGLQWDICKIWGGEDVRSESIKAITAAMDRSPEFAEAVGRGEWFVWHIACHPDDVDKSVGATGAGCAGAGAWLAYLLEEAKARDYAAARKPLTEAAAGVLARRRK